MKVEDLYLDDLTHIGFACGCFARIGIRSTGNLVGGRALGMGHSLCKEHESLTAPQPELSELLPQLKVTEICIIPGTRIPSE